MIDLGIPSGLFLEQPWYEDLSRDPGRDCGECGRLLKIYQRRLSRSMARGMIRLYLLGIRYNREYFHVKNFDKEGARGEFGVLSCWGLVVEQANQDNAKKSSGMWALTPFGAAFIKQEESVPRNVILKWGSEFLGFSGPMVNVKDCLEYGNKFKYDELMKSEPEAFF